MTKTAAIIQARLGSSRLPGKVLADLAGDTMLARVVQRSRAAALVDEVVVATTTNASDDPVCAEADRLGVRWYRGSEQDVLARYVGATHECGADVVVRITSDCPLLDPGVVDRVVGALTRSRDYASNTHVRTYPRGLDVEAFHAGTLERIARLATSPAAHEHVTAFVMERPALFSIRHVVAAHADDSDLRWTVDTAEDIALVRALYARFDLATQITPYRALVQAVRVNPELAAVNSHVVQKSWNRVA
ncbi:MAG TPA: glycosyltransferase family protein [Kofleriaceae bacterium]|jgi:spore coat polysaccharide biosynthesis protein SpsF|nr:glycosyltransferase family protein [Kofleriaceae bacterium]